MHLKTGGRLVRILFILAITATFTFHCYTYFFLFDDYAIVGDAAELTVSQIATTPLIAFYRPVAFLLTKADFAIAGWQFPWVYAATSIVLHLVNALVLFLLSRKIGLDRVQAQLTTAFFALSPWASETYYWTSARFDLITALGVLLALYAGLSAMEVRGGLRFAIGCVLTFAATTLAVFSKEAGVVAPVLLFMSIWLSRPSRALRSWRVVALLCSSAAAAIVYVVIRQRILPSFDGAYGKLADLLIAADVAANAWSYFSALAHLPFPEASLGKVAATLIPVLAIGTLAVSTLLYVLVTRPKTALLLVVCFCVSLLPVIWFRMPETGSGGGRMLYMPALWFCVLLGFAADLANWRGMMRVVVAAALLIAFVSVANQRRVWEQATNLARATMEQLKPYRHSNQPLFVANMPFWFDEGAYVIKDYSFSRYFAPTTTQVRGRAMQLKYGQEGARFRQWVPIAEFGDITPAPAERIVFLDLPVSGMPLVPAQPSAPRSHVEAHTVQLDWLSGEGGGRVEGFTIEASLDATFATIFATLKSDDPRPQRRVTPVPSNTYFVRVIAFNRHGTSVPSPTKCVTVP